MKFLLRITTIAILVITVASCESPMRRAMQIDADYDDIFAEAVQAVNKIQYRIVSADKSSGLIVGGRQSSTSTNIVVDLNVTVRRTQSGVEVNVALLPRKSVIHIGDYGVEEELSEYTDALKARFPNLKISH